jgi:predicted ATPase with chaperone activity
MSASVLVPLSHRLALVRAERRAGPPSLKIDGLFGASGRTAADRVRAAIANSGFAFPRGEISVCVDSDDECVVGSDLAVALAVLLVDPAHKSVRRDGVVAVGSLQLSGALYPVEGPLVADLCGGAWVARIWDPVDRIPRPDEDAVLTIADVRDLLEAWEALHRLIDIEGRPDLRCDCCGGHDRPPPDATR